MVTQQMLRLPTSNSRMEFRTQIEKIDFEPKVEYRDKILSIGSCFASSIGEKLRQSKFQIEVNPMGVLFNPCSIVATLERLLDCRLITHDELRLSSSGVWFHYDFHGSLSSTLKEECLENINSAIEAGHRALLESNVLIITLGTTWVYSLRESQEVVANCHKQPSKLFDRYSLDIEPMVEMFEKLFARLPNTRVILSVSPIRHLADGLTENSLSKALLRVVCSRLSGQHERITYFPSYEIMMDDLRDYRFYDRDMMHPSSQAVDYIWEQFQSMALTEESRSLIKRVTQIVRAASHRPLNPRSDEHRAFCRAQLDKIRQLPLMNFDAERESFEIWS